MINVNAIAITIKISSVFLSQLHFTYFSITYQPGVKKMSANARFYSDFSFLGRDISKRRYRCFAENSKFGKWPICRCSCEKVEISLFCRKIQISANGRFVAAVAICRLLECLPDLLFTFWRFSKKKIHRSRSRIHIFVFSVVILYPESKRFRRFMVKWLDADMDAYVH